MTTRYGIFGDAYYQVNKTGDADVDNAIRESIVFKADGYRNSRSRQFINVGFVHCDQGQAGAMIEYINEQNTSWMPAKVKKAAIAAIRKDAELD